MPIVPLVLMALAYGLIVTIVVYRSARRAIRLNRRKCFMVGASQGSRATKYIAAFPDQLTLSVEPLRVGEEAQPERLRRFPSTPQVRTRPGAPTTSRDLIRLTAAAVCVVDFFVDDRSVDDVGAGLFCVSGLARPAGGRRSPFTRSSLLQKGLTLWTCIIAIFWKRFANLAFAQLRWEERLRASTGWLAALYRFLQPIQVNYTALLSVVFLFFCVFVVLPLIIIVRQCGP